MPQHDPIAVKDITDLRFMTLVYGQVDGVGTFEQLKEMWEKPPAHLHDAMLHHHRQDLDYMLMNILIRQKNWSELEQHCHRMLTETQWNLKLTASESKSKFRQLCAWRWDVWENLLSAIYQNHPPAKYATHRCGLPLHPYPC
jgi:hypothetical protein